MQTYVIYANHDAMTEEQRALASSGRTFVDPDLYDVVFSEEDSGGLTPPFYGAQVLAAFNVHGGMHERLGLRKLGPGDCVGVGAHLLACDEDLLWFPVPNGDTLLHLIKKKCIRVVRKAPGKDPEVIHTFRTLANLQALVDGPIEMYRFGDQYRVVVSEMGNALPANYSENIVLSSVAPYPLRGTIIVAREGGCELVDMTEDEAAHVVEVLTRSGRKAS
jgi:hypothetical protein